MEGPRPQVLPPVRSQGLSLLLEFTPISGLLPGGEQLCPISPLLPQSPAGWTHMDDRDPESKALTHTGLEQQP